MKVKVDMHVHPNLPKSDERAIAKAGEWWAVLKKKGIMCIISAEHCYSNPKRNFWIMEKTAPKGFIVLPGVEAISKEGVDIVAFYKDSSIYREKKLLLPYSMKTDVIVGYLNKRGYAYYISHPFTLGTTSIIKNLGEEKALRIMNKAKSVEIHNTAFSGAARFLEKTGLSIVFRNKYQKMVNVENLPEEYWKNIKFISGGSDAHKPSDLGSCMTLETKSMSPAELYRAIVSNKKDRFFANNRFLISNIITSLINSACEWLTKKKYKLLH